MYPIPEVTDLDMAFGSTTHYPKGIKELKVDRKWTDLFSELFYNGYRNISVTFKEGADPKKAMRAIRAAMTSFEPKHEDKEKAVGYMLSEWIEDWKKEEM